MIEEKEKDPLRELFAQRPEADLPDASTERPNWRRRGGADGNASVWRCCLPCRS